MLHYAVVSFVVAVLAAMYGFSGIPVVAAEIARMLFFMFMAVFLVTLVIGVVMRRRSPPERHGI
jgi:uncharacterized membrane protein YtjA (UPF0391 family)